MSEVIETKVVCKQEGRYIGWPTLGKSHSGELFVLFSGDREHHVCPFGKDYIISSLDNGKTWSSPELINDTAVDDRDTGLCVMYDGTLVMTWFTSYFYGRYEVLNKEYGSAGKNIKPWVEWEKQIRRASSADIEKWTPLIIEPEKELSEKWVNAAKELGCTSYVEYEENNYPPATRRLGFWSRRSYDNGKTWDKPTRTPVFAPHGPNVLADGRLVYVGNGHFAGKSCLDSLGAAVSEDQGKTWEITAEIKTVFEKNGETAILSESHIVEAASGKILGLSRIDTEAVESRYLWQFESNDKGRTWTEPVETKLQGFPPHLLRLKDGRILVSYAIRHDPPGVRFCFSSDEGVTWDIENQLCLTDAPDGDLGYVSTVEMDDGSFISVYYQKDKSDEKPCLMMTRWK